MPSLGFLKKKRTRDSNHDPSNSSNPTSPVAATSSSRPSEAAGSTSKTAASGPAPAPAPAQSSSIVPAPSQQQQQQQHMNPANAQGGTAFVAQMPMQTGHADSQNLPSISNLIHQPQNGGSSHNFSSAPYNHNPAALGAQIVPPPSASPGTDPARMQQQQQQVYSQPVMQSQPNAGGGGQLPDQHQQHQPQYQQQYQSQLPHSQQSNDQRIHHHHQHQGSVTRVTKGKYSLGDFEVLRTLGTGSFGRVHLVQSKHNQRFYAIKVLKKAQVVKMKQVEHTNDERRMLSDVKHPFLITLWGTFQDWKNLYMVMDFVEGGELFSLLRKSGRFPNPVAKFYAAEATLALEYLHSKNIIYRDLKPENLLLDRHGHLKITDFGFAKKVPDKTWTLCGTPDYLAPEVVSNKGYNKSVDWWSLGILIYEMLCGYTPFWDSGSPMRIYENILKGKVKYPQYINPDAQNLLERLITADLTKRLEVTWDRLARKDIDAPYTPPVKAGTGDASQFDRYPEDPEKYGGPGGHDEYDTRPSIDLLAY